MIQIVAKNFVKPEKREAFLVLAKELIQKSQKEAGCITYDLHVNLKDENELTFIEEWADMAAVDAHNASAHFTTLVPKLNECISDSDVALYKNL